MNATLHASLAAQQFGRPVSQHLIEIHIGLRTGTGLPDRKRKFIFVQASKYFVGCRNNGIRLARIEQAQSGIDLRRRALDLCQGQNDLFGHALL